MVVPSWKSIYDAYKKSMHYFYFGDADEDSSKSPAAAARSVDVASLTLPAPASPRRTRTLSGRVQRRDRSRSRSRTRNRAKSVIAMVHRTRSRGRRRRSRVCCDLSSYFDFEWYADRIPSPPLTRAYVLFGLRQGAILIAINDILWTAFLVFLLTLAFANLQEVTTIVSADAEARAVQPQGKITMTSAFPAIGVLVEEDGVETMYGNAVSECCGRRVMSASIILALVMTSADMVTCLLLLFGAAMRMRKLIMPWMSMRLLDIVILSSSLMVASNFVTEGVGLTKVLLVGVILLIFIFYHWLVVYSFHDLLMEAERDQGRIKHSVHVATVPEAKIDMPGDAEAGLGQDQHFLFSICNSDHPLPRVQLQGERNQEQRERDDFPFDSLE